ncbi:MAG: hypothetical protein J5563_06800 [Clostridia bacterium]|nr:hypothetical protein [Clostridia bacterium]
MDNGEEIRIAPKWLRIIGKIIKWSIITVAFALIAWLSLRVIWQRGPGAYRKYAMTSAAEQEYRQNGLHIFRLEALNTNELGKLFYIDSVYYTEEERSFQFTLRYNIYAEGAAGLVPEDLRFYMADSEGNVYDKYLYNFENTAMYYHFLLVFEDVPLDDLTVVVTNGGQRVDSCVVFRKDGNMKEYRISGSEKKVGVFREGT